MCIHSQEHMHWLLCVGVLGKAFWGPRRRVSSYSPSLCLRLSSSSFFHVFFVYSLPISLIETALPIQLVALINAIRLRRTIRTEHVQLSQEQMNLYYRESCVPDTLGISLIRDCGWCRALSSLRARQHSSRTVYPKSASLIMHTHCVFQQA